MKIYSAANLADVASEWSDNLSREADNRHSPQHRKRKKRRTRPENRDRAPEWQELAEEGAARSEQVGFCSRSEAICAELLKQYVPHFTAVEGITCQVAIGIDAQGNKLTVDFVVDGVFFEYHPVRLFKNRRRCGDFRSKREYRDYTTICHSLRGEQRDFFQHAMRAQLSQNYYAKRRALLDQHPVYRRMELVVASSPDEFYFLILKRFGHNVPRTVERFRAIFEELQETLPG